MRNLIPTLAWLLVPMLAACASQSRSPDDPVLGAEPIGVRGDAGSLGITQTSPLWVAQFGGTETPLEVLPGVSAASPPDDLGVVEVTVRNAGDTTLVYWGYGPDTAQVFIEVRTDGDWETGGWDWCGTGMKAYEIAPGESVVLRVRLGGGDADSGRRVLTGFGEKDADRRSYVVLATTG